LCWLLLLPLLLLPILSCVARLPCSSPGCGCCSRKASLARGHSQQWRSRVEAAAIDGVQGHRDTVHLAAITQVKHLDIV
jgi:hypothetical protein